MENKGENTQIPNKSLSITGNKEPMDKVEEKSKSFTDKIVYSREYIVYSKENRIQEAEFRRQNSDY